MRDFQWIVNDNFLYQLRPELLITLSVLLVILAVTAVFVARELRQDRKK